MSSIDVRPATEHDKNALQKMPPYAKCGLGLPCSEEVLLAVNSGKVLGAVSICQRDILCVYGEWKRGFEQCLNSLTRKVSGGWISKLYVFPEYRHRGVGTGLVKEAVKSLKERDFDEVYAGIYVKNRFMHMSSVQKTLSRNSTEKNDKVIESEEKEAREQGMTKTILSC